MNKQLVAYMALAASMGACVPNVFRPKHPEIDIKKEYELIKQKKSKLSANKRKWVLRQYEKLSFKDS